MGRGADARSSCQEQIRTAQPAGCPCDGAARGQGQLSAGFGHRGCDGVITDGQIGTYGNVATGQQPHMTGLYRSDRGSRHQNAPGPRQIADIESARNDSAQLFLGQTQMVLGAQCVIGPDQNVSTGRSGFEGHHPSQSRVNCGARMNEQTVR